MNSKELKSLNVLTVDGGEKLGSLARTYVDGTEMRIVGFAFREGGSFMQVESEPKLDTSDIHSLGPDALLLDHKESVHGAEVNERAGELQILEEISGRSLLTEGGDSMGEVASISFDAHSFALTEIELSAGHFKANTTIPIDQVVIIGRDYVIVNDGDARPGEAPAKVVSIIPAGETSTNVPSVPESATVHEPV